MAEYLEILCSPVHVSAADTDTSMPFPVGVLMCGSGVRAEPDFLVNRYATGVIVGTVKEKASPENLPLARMVRLYRERDGLLIRESWSDAFGVYRFDAVEEHERYTVVAYDHAHAYRAVVADNLLPELMT